MAYPGIGHRYGRIRTTARLLRAVLFIAILATLLPARPADAQIATCFTVPTSPAPPDFGVEESPRAIAVGDFNGDGKGDLAIANQGSNTVSIRLGKGDGSFISAANVITGDGPISVAIGDLNGDGRHDLAVATFGSKSVSIWLGVGNGTFNGQSVMGVASTPRAVVIRNLDNDGWPDLAVSNGDVITILAGVGNGTFTLRANVPVGSIPQTPAFGDLDGDRILDLVVANTNSGTVSIRLGNGDGTFDETSNIAAGVNPNAVVLGDFNDDGDLDLAVTNGFADIVLIRIGNGDGSFENAPDLIAGDGPSGMALGDLNGDDQPDLVVANVMSNTVSIRLVVGDGTFTDTVEVGTGDAPSAVALGDFTGDGRLDFAVVNESARTVSVRIGNGDGTFGLSAAVGVSLFPESVAIGDFNGDLKSDLAVVSSYTETVSIRIGSGNGTFSNAPDVGVRAGIDGRSQVVAIGDLNGDGRLDLAVTNINGHAVAIRLGHGNGTFTGPNDSPAAVSVGERPYGIAIGDLNADGRLDLAVANGQSDTVSIRLGNGDGTFREAADVRVGDVPISVAIGDLNGDGRLDLAVLNATTAGTVSIRLGKGDGTFTGLDDSPAVVGVGRSPQTVAIGDLNGDGRLDLAVANLYSSTVSVRLGNGQGAFANTAELGVGHGPYSVVIGDLNGDGRNDLAATNIFGNSVSVRLGSVNGDGSFTNAADVSVGNRPKGLAIGQLNADRKLDLAIVNDSDHIVSIRLNTCGQDLIPQPHVPAAQTVPEDGTLVFSPTNRNAITVTDDGRSATLHVSLTAASGAVTLGTTAGLRFTSGDGTADSTTTFSGTVAQVNTALTGLGFSPSPQYSGPAGLTITVHDNGHGGGPGGPTPGVAAVSIAVTAVDDAPTAVNDSYSVGAQTSLTVPPPGVLANDTDVDSAPGSLTAAVVATPTRGNLTLQANGGFTYTPSPGFAGSDSFTYQARDSTGPSGPATVSITVGNAAPTAGNDTFTVTAGTVLAVAAPGLLANDADSDSAALTAIKVADPARGGLTLAPDGSFTYTPAAGFTGTDSFTYRASDGIAQSQPATATIVVTAAGPTPITVSGAPAALNDAYSTPAQTTLTVPAPGLLANDTDPDSPRLTAAKASEPANGSLTLNPDGGFVYAPRPGFVGTDAFTYRVSDGSGQSSVATVSLSVTATACGPRPKIQTTPVASGGRLSVHLESSPTNTRQNNPLKQITFGTPQNARVTLKGQPAPLNEPIVLPSDTHAVDFTVERLVAGQPATVPFSVVDGCGEWKSFVGGGAEAGF